MKRRSDIDVGHRDPAFIERRMVWEEQVSRARRIAHP
jgi:hypothetical protein